MAVVSVAAAREQTVLVWLPVQVEIENVVMNFATAIAIAFGDDQFVAETVRIGSGPWSG